MATEHLIIHLPLAVEVVGVIGEAVGARWPGATIITDHDYGDYKLVIRIDLAAGVEPDLDDDEPWAADPSE